MTKLDHQLGLATKDVVRCTYGTSIKVYNELIWVWPLACLYRGTLAFANDSINSVMLSNTFGNDFYSLTVVIDVAVPSGNNIRRSLRSMRA